MIRRGLAAAIPQERCLMAAATPVSAGPPRLRNLFRGGHTAEVMSVAFSPDGKTIGSGGADNDVKLWDPVNGRQTATLKGQTGWVRPLAFSHRRTTTGTDLALDACSS